MRVLMVEDEEVVAKNLKKLLELKGFAVDWLPTAEKAFTRALLYRDEYGVMLLDLTLPGMDGAALTSKLREEQVTVPIIILTGRSETKDKIALLNAGADDYVIKPFSSDELIARIGSVLRRPVASQPVVHTAGDLTIETALHRVRVADADVQLTLKEYALLECFVRHQNEVLSREELCNQVWDFNSLTRSNVLDVHMKNLRRKLQMSGMRRPRFETVRGIGYRLVV